MIKIRRSAIVRHSPTQMFDLVNDVEAYPRRFTWCADARVLARDETSIAARLDLRLGGLTQGFTTRNTLDAPHSIEMQLVEGPFLALHGVWSFAPLGAKLLASGPADSPTGCKIAFALDFDYSGLMSSMLQTGFQKLADRMVDEFCREAERIYV